MCKVIEEMRKEEREEGRREGRQEGIQEGIQKGNQERMITTARRMLETGKYVLDEIANISGLSLDEVKKLQAERSVYWGKP